jgi:glyoxylase-like metal-dependent hydrolase (beta-lactamase superfamily II)
MARWLLAFSALLVVGTGILIAHYRALDSDLDGARDVAFGKIAPDLYRLGHTWTVVKKLLEVNVAVFLIKSGKNYILIDTGVPGPNYTTILIDAVRDATKNGKLRMILCKRPFR